MIVYLNGELVESAVIDSAKHTYVGLYRPSSTAHLHGAYVLCSCGNVLQTVDAVTWHWSAGHLDIPQYVDIKHNVKPTAEMLDRLDRIKETHAWHSKLEPCKCNVCFLLELVCQMNVC